MTTKHVEVNLHKFEKGTDPATFDEKAFFNKRRWSGPQPVGGANGAIAAPPGGFKWNRAYLFDVVFCGRRSVSFSSGMETTKDSWFLEFTIVEFN